MELIFEFISIIWCSTNLLFVLKCFFNEPIYFSKKHWLRIGLSFIILLGVSTIAGFKNVNSLLAVIVIGGIVAYYRPKKKLGGIMSTMSVLIIMIMPMNLILYGYSLLTGQMMDTIHHTSYNIMDTITNLFWTGILYWWYKRDFKIVFNKWDRWLLFLMSLLSVILFQEIERLMLSYDIEGYGKLFNYGIFIVTFLIIGLSIVAIVKSRGVEYYQQKVALSRKHMQMQLEHFEIYKEMQHETRKIKHDMKNHLVCLNEMYKSNKVEEMGQYIEGLLDKIQNIEHVVRSGNMIVDAIVNQKNSYLQKEEINIDIEGDFSVLKNIEAIHLCTIIGNLVDNAIEATEQIEKGKRWIAMTIRQTTHYALLYISNTTINRVEIKDNRILTHKKDQLNHGIGLENIQEALKVYKGDMQLIANYNEKVESYVFEVKILIPLETTIHHQ